MGPAASDAPSEDPRGPEASRFPLLREGSFVVRAPATLRFEPSSGTWIVALRDDLETERDREITVLPSEALEDMMSLIRGRTTVQWFELTAMVLTYKGRNFLLPMLGTPLSQEPPRHSQAARLPPGAVALPPGAVVRAPTSAVVRAPAGTVASPQSPNTDRASDAGSTTQPAALPTSIDPETFAAEIERALDARVQVVPRSSDVGTLPTPVARGRSSSRIVDGPAPVTLPTSARVHDRRGVVTRDPITGTWRFVFHGERADMGERGVELLPSTVLERMERFVREHSTAPALLVSGQLTRFEGRNYLLPSSFRTIAAGRWIYP